jgi:spore maturation protein CgeB
VPPVQTGARVLLVAKFNQRYHRTGCALRDALVELGCVVGTVEERTRGFDALLRRSLADRLERTLRRHRPDLVLVFKGASLEPELIERLRPLGSARWVNWFPDGPHLLDLSLRIGRAYDRCFLFDSSMADRHRELGRAAEYLALGCDPAFHRPLRAPGDESIPIVFIGSVEPSRDAALDAVAGLGLQVWGPDRPRGPLYGDAMVRAFSRADVALNVHQFFADPPDVARYGTGANQRVFELAAIGTVQLSDAKADIARELEEDSEIVLYRTLPALREKAAWLLDRPAEREAIARRARARALGAHTWRHRLEELLAVSLR